MKPLVYLITIHWRHLDATKEFLSSLQNADYDNLSVVLINNDPEPFPENIIQNFKNIHVINNFKNVGFAKAMNQGIQYALENNATYIMPINNDTIINPNTISILIDHTTQYPNDIVSPVILKYGTNEIDNIGIQCLFPLAIFRLLKTYNPRKIYALSGACFMGNRDQFEKIGLFDEGYFSFAEDIDWSVRARKHKFNLTIINESKIWHKHSVSTTEGAGWGPVKFYYIARNTMIFARKNLNGFKKLYFMTIYTLLGGPLHLLFFCRSMASFKAYLNGLLVGLNLIQKGNFYE